MNKHLERVDNQHPGASLLNRHPLHFFSAAATLTETTKHLEVFRRLRQVLKDDLEGKFPTDYGEHSYPDLDAIKQAFFCAFDREIRIVEELLPSTPQQVGSPEKR